MSCSTHALVKKTSTVVMHCSWIKLSWRAISSDRRIPFSSETDDSWVENPWKTVFSVASLISLSIKHGPGWLSVRAHWSSSTPVPSVSCSSLVYALGNFPTFQKRNQSFIRAHVRVLYFALESKTDDNKGKSLKESTITQRNYFKGR